MLLNEINHYTGLLFNKVLCKRLFLDGIHQCRYAVLTVNTLYEKVREQDKRRQEGWRKGRKKTERIKYRSSPYLCLTPLTCTGNHLTSAKHLVVDHVTDRGGLHYITVEREDVCLVHFQAVLFFPSGANASQLISREAGLDTQKLDFSFCSHLILEIFFF